MKKLNQNIVRELQNAAYNVRSSMVRLESVADDRMSATALRAVGVDDEDAAERLADLIHDHRGSERDGWVYLDETAGDDLVAFFEEYQLPLSCHRLVYDEDGVVVELQEVTP